MAISVIRRGGLLTVLTTNKSFYFPGEPVRISLFKLNISPYPIILTYPTSQRYEFTATGFSGEVWRWSADRVFLPVVEQVQLSPGESRAYTETWAQIDFQGRTVAPGLYRITGWNTAENSSVYPRPSVFISIAR